MEPLKKLPEGTQLTVGSHHVTIVKYLSEGGFAHIYKVSISPKQYDSDIACLKRVVVPDKRGLDLLRKEVDVMKKLSHSNNIVRYYDSHAERLDNGAYQVLLLMELCPNKSLLDFMNARIKTKLSEPEILNIMLDISRAVLDMHKLKLIHRDIKIENVLIDANHRFKLCDFGSTSSPLMPPKTQEEFQALAHDITYQTTPQYRSPEMIDLYRGLPIDEKADIWALGCFLYKLCYYTTPFEANGDIAILHASFQFPPLPNYSGDLKNLIIIMLQENPFFRPNIFQVIKLVSKIMKIDFKSLNVEDIYDSGSYDFQALHDYQQKRQQELIKQQQIYYEQQQKQQYLQQQNMQRATSLNSQTASDTQPQTVIDEQDSKEVYHDDELSDNELDTTLGDIGDIDDIEQRYPSIDNIDDDLETPKSDTASVKSSIPTGATTSYPEASLPKSRGMSPQPESHVVHQHSSSLKLAVPPNNYVHPYNMAYPVQPPVLSSLDLQKLTPEQLQQYNYQHQQYQYQLSQWMYKQQQMNRFPQNQTVLTSVPQYQQEAQGSNPKKSTEFERKEAWEKQDANVDEEAGKLADDIFGSKSRSPHEAIQTQQKTSQSAKSEPAYSDFKEEPEIESTEQRESKVRLTKSNNSSELDLRNDPPVKTRKPLEPKSDQLAPTELELLHEDKPYTSPATEEPTVPLKDSSSIPQQEVSRSSNHHHLVENQLDHHDSQNIQQVPISSMPPSTGKTYNPFPVDSSNSGSIPSAPVHQTRPTAVPLANTKSDSMRSSNPWEEYRSSQSVPKVNDPSLLNKMNNLYIDNRNNEQQLQSRQKSIEEPNLIDLEVGLESDSSSSTPALVSRDSLTMGAGTSLIDLDLDEKPKVNERPHFKKKSIPNPSDFKVKEEVIDWASDDEAPEHASQMSRVSIRNSLKKQQRKTSEQKRSDSNSGENRKRLSRLISNS